jgi:hypothetical protein
MYTYDHQQHLHLMLTPQPNRCCVTTPMMKKIPPVRSLLVPTKAARVDVAVGDNTIHVVGFGVIPMSSAGTSSS